MIQQKESDLDERGREARIISNNCNREENFHVDVIREIEFSELESMIRTVPLIEGKKLSSPTHVYQDANISFREIFVNEVNLTTFYILRKNLEFQRTLRKYLLAKEGIDTLHLNCAYELKNEKNEIWMLTPPIIEVTPRRLKYVAQIGEKTYEDSVVLQIPIVNDGAHRVFLAKEEKETFTSIYISNALENFPFYAHPNDWSKVKIVEKIPEKKEDKKFYSRENCYGLYRDFGVLGCGAPRGVGK
ncbi:MAG: hypothetical protein WC758_05710 [Candidatus Woesearchaeota archaeon]|jgi:hypothetical protein